MNVPFDKFNASDAARILGVDAATVRGWCKNNVINFIDVSEPGSNNGRYQISESEIDYIKSLIKKFGVRKAMLNYRKDWNMKKEKPKMGDDVINFDIDPLPWYIDLNAYNNEEELTKKIENDVKKELGLPIEEENSKRAKAEKIVDTIMYIQDVKERIEDCRAELNQLLNEYEQLKAEVQEVL